MIREHIIQYWSFNYENNIHIQPLGAQVDEIL